jgi:DNA mismatch repair protein MutL
LKREAQEPARGIGAFQPRPSFAGVMDSSLPYSRTPFADFQRRVSNATSAAPSHTETKTDGFFSTMTVLGQILGCYLVCACPRGLALIDQHAAHERVTFEKLRRQLKTGEVQKQNLLIRQTLQLAAGEGPRLQERLAALDTYGFVVEPFGPDGYAITAVPALLPEGDYRELVQRMVGELADVHGLRRHLEEHLATIACHSAIRAHRKLEVDEMRRLLNDLDEIDFATQCPHGRPVVLEFDRDELEKMFKRKL